MEGNKNAGKLYSFLAGFMFAAILFIVFLVSFKFVLAVWQEPTQPPPAGNILPPINTGPLNQVKSGGLTINGVATTSKLCFGSVGDDCQTSWNDVLGAWKSGTNGIFYDAGNVGIGLAITGLPAWPLVSAKLAINTGSAEGLYISRNSAVPYSYINVRTSTNQPVFKVHESGSVAIGTDNPNSNSDLHIYNTTRNAEINLQSIAGVNEHWAIYHDRSGTDELRLWNGNADRVKFSNVGVVTASDFCTDGGKCLAGSVVASFAGLVTPGTYNGSQGGYVGMKNVCNTRFSGSHICSSDEMLTISRTPSSLAGTSGYAWVSTGVAGFKEDLLINDCVGWTNSTANAYGSIWNFNGASTAGGSVWLSSCNIARQIACCR